MSSPLGGPARPKMNTGYGIPSRRRLRGPLHPPNRPRPSCFEDTLATSTAQSHLDESALAMPPPSSTPSGKKREWTATIGRGGLGSLPWEQAGPSVSGPYQQQYEVPRTELSFQSVMGFPTSTSTASMASLASMPSSSSSSSFVSLRPQQTPMSASPTSFRTAGEADDSSFYSARNTIFSRGDRSAQVSLRETSQAMNDAHNPADDPPRKRRRGLAGAIVDTALNAALYTGAAALTAYSLWSSWGHSVNGENQSHHPEAGPEADMGHVISQHKRPMAGHAGGKEPKMPPGGLEEPPPPYYDDQLTPSKQPQQASTPQSSSARMRKVFVSSQRNRRRPTFQGSKPQRQSTPRKALPQTFRDAGPAAHSDLATSSQVATATRTEGFNSSGDDDGKQNRLEEEEDDDDENDEILLRFQEKMNALIAEGQAALNSTPVLQESDLREIDTPSSSLDIGMSWSRPQHMSSRASQRFDTSFGTDSPFANRLQQPAALPSPLNGVARSNSHPAQLAPADGESLAFLPEPVKRTFATPTGSQGLIHSRSVFDFSVDAQSESATNRTSSPFVFGRNDSAPGSPSLRAAATRRVTDFDTAARTSNRSNGNNPYMSRIPRSISRKSGIEPKRSPF